MGTAPPAARVFDPKGMENETRICVHYLWSGVTILNLLFPISPLPFFSFYRLKKGSLLAYLLESGESISFFFFVYYIMIDL
jgi:hypothetical protein